MKSVILAESRSPEGANAFVEYYNKCVYFYVVHNLGKTDEQVAKCWVCNTVKAPKKYSLFGMKLGRPPRQIADFCDHPKGMGLPGDLKIIWGDGFCLLASGISMLALVIFGAETELYTRHTLQQSPIGMPFAMIPEDTVDAINVLGFEQ